MNASEYQELANRTAKVDRTATENFTDYAMGLAGEVGELINYLKKWIYHGHRLDKDIIEEEGGDCLWYLVMIFTTAGLSLDDIMAGNIDKLRRRYPSGFSEERSRRRDDGK